MNWGCLAPSHPVAIYKSHRGPDQMYKDHYSDLSYLTCRWFRRITPEIRALKLDTRIGGYFPLAPPSLL